MKFECGDYRGVLPGRGQAPPFTSRFFGKGVSVVGVVILSAAKNLSPSRTQILRCAQNDRRERRVSKTLPVKAALGPRPGRTLSHYHFAIVSHI